jgi:PKD repeat protein
VNIISNGTEGIAPATFEFEAQVMGGMAPYTIRWDFGDSSSDSEINAQTVLHTFDQAGRYNVGLIVTDSQNQIAFDSIAITVEEGELLSTEEEQPPESDNDDLGSDDTESLFDGSERQSNDGISIGGRGPTVDYDATADD